MWQPRVYSPYQTRSPENVQTRVSRPSHDWRDEDEASSSRRLSGLDALTTTRHFPRRSGERWRLGRASRRQDILCKFCWNCVFLFTAHWQGRQPLSLIALESCRISKLASSSASSTCTAPLLQPEIFVFFLFFAVLHWLYVPPVN